MADEYLKAVIEDALDDYPGNFGWDALDYEERVPELAEHIATALRQAKDPMR